MVLVGTGWQLNSAIVLHVDIPFFFFWRLSWEYTKSDLFVPGPVKGFRQVEMDVQLVEEK